MSSGGHYRGRGVARGSGGGSGRGRLVVVLGVVRMEVRYLLKEGGGSVFVVVVVCGVLMRMLVVEAHDRGRGGRGGRAEVVVSGEVAVGVSMIGEWRGGERERLW